MARASDRLTGAGPLVRLAARLGIRRAARRPRLRVPLPVLEPADPAVADAIYAGTFRLAGETVEAARRSPFLVEPPSQAWAAELHGFSFLRHIAAADTRVARSNGASLVAEWLRDLDDPPPVAFSPAVVSRRVAAWLAAGPALLCGADPAFEKLFLAGLERDVARLSRFLRRPSAAAERLDAAIALVAATHALDRPEREARRARRTLRGEIDRQILPDGGHRSRSPLALLKVLAALLPALSVMEARGIAAAAEGEGALLEAVDRMVPMLSFFRHPDGSLARFNGVGETPADLLAAVLSAAGRSAAAPDNARYSGFQRIEAGGVAILMDTGAAPPAPFAGAAHAGCLSFEMADRTVPVIVNCGVPAGASPAWRAAARTTAAHSTLVLDDTASARIPAAGGPLEGGPSAVPVERIERDGRISVAAGHDGYRRRFGIVHRRALTVSADGETVAGRDSLAGAGVGENRPFAIRFHLDHRVRTSVSPTGRAVLLTVGDGTIWRFSVEPGPSLALEESVRVTPDGAVRPTVQLVLSGRTGQNEVVRWRLERQLRG